jgi:hypothetical protein
MSKVRPGRRVRPIPLVLTVLTTALVWLEARIVLTRGVTQPGAPVPEAGAAREDWQFAYEEANLEQVRSEIESLRRFMLEETRDYYEQQFRAGNYELVTERRIDGTIPLDVGVDLSQWRYTPARGTTRVVLPRVGFENVYEARNRLTWLLTREDDLEAFDALLTKKD